MSAVTAEKRPNNLDTIVGSCQLSKESPESSVEKILKLWDSGNAASESSDDKEEETDKWIIEEDTDEREDTSNSVEDLSKSNIAANSSTENETSSVNSKNTESDKEDDERDKSVIEDAAEFTRDREDTLNNVEDLSKSNIAANSNNTEDEAISVNSNPDDTLSASSQEISPGNEEIVLSLSLSDSRRGSGENIHVTTKNAKDEVIPADVPQRVSASRLDNLSHVNTSAMSLRIPAIELLEPWNDSTPPVSPNNLKDSDTVSLASTATITSIRDLLNPGCSRHEAPIVSLILGTLKLSPVRDLGGICSHPLKLQLEEDLGICNHLHKSQPEEDVDICTRCPWLRNYCVSLVAPRYKLLSDGCLQVCHLDHKKTIISKILSSRFLRRWEVHHLYLNDTRLTSKTPIGFMESPIKYTAIQDVYLVTRWDSGQKYYLRIMIPNGSYLFQTSVPYSRDQWYYSIMWKKNMFKYRTVLKGAARQDIILKEIKNMVEFAMTIPIQDDEVTRMPVTIVSNLLSEVKHMWGDRRWSEELMSSVAPLLENCPPSLSICELFSYHCVHFPRSYVIKEVVSTSVCHILKHNVDFGKYPYMRKLVMDYVKALSVHSNSSDVLCKFVSSVHGENYDCPHNRVLPNLVSACVSGIFRAFEGITVKKPESRTILELENPDDPIESYDCYLRILTFISLFEDWVPTMGQLLQPVPVPKAAFYCPHFLSGMEMILRNICSHPKCESHQMILAVRKEKSSWFDVFSPISPHCIDRGDLWGIMLDRLLGCCCKRKPFICELTGKRLEALLLLSLRDHEASNVALCLMLEWQLLANPDDTRQIIATLQTSQSGSRLYGDLRQKLKYLEDFQQKDGPEKLTLPCRSVDKDFRTLMSTGSFGNLIDLSLAFTHITSECSDILIKLSALKHLNLWGTKFGDTGVVMIADYLTELETLNLCETPVSDVGVSSLTALTKLVTLNLNSTCTTLPTIEALKSKLPNLVNLDVKYTDAWPS